jgi:putative serine/threonine protein kinase
LSCCVPIPKHYNKFLFTSPKLVNLLCYPKFGVSDYSNRIKDLISLDIKFLFLEGDTVVNNNNVLGKGCEGLVLRVENDKSDKMALKVKRTDSCRLSMRNEFDLYMVANKFKIGPKVYSCTDNLLLMELINGMSVFDWFLKTRLDLYLIKTVAIDILTQCFVLDEINLDHGQLNRLNNHVIVSPGDLRCTIIDFESASQHRKVSNLTTAFQALFFKGNISKQISKFINYDHKKSDFMKLLKIYKDNICKENFDSIISLI